MATYRVTTAEIRRHFNDSGYYERDDVLKTLKSRHPASPDFHQPPGTASETVLYSEIREGRFVSVAIVHQFVLPDGTISNSVQRPDPKWLRVGDNFYLIQRNS